MPLNYRSKILASFFLILLGALIMFILQYFQNTPAPPSGEYYYSKLLRLNFTCIAILLYTITGFTIGYYFQLNCFIVGISLIGIFPITSIIESTIYPGSHNLIPFEFAVFFVYGLPAIIAAFAGKWLFEKSYKRKLP